MRCAGQPITEIIIRAQAPGYGGLFERSQRLGRIVTALHVTTAPSAIANFVLLRKGDPCDPLLRSESERILRAMPFIADASVTAYPDGIDGVRVEVVTIDEPSVLGSAGVRGGSPYLTGLTIGNTNFLGNAILVAGNWREGDFYRDRFVGRYTNYQLFGRPYQLNIQGARRELGGDWHADVSYPFLTDVQKSAWRVAVGSAKEYARFLRRGDAPASSLMLDRRYMDAGAILRIGRPGLLGLVGAQLSFEENSPSRVPVLITDTGIVADTTTVLVDRFDRAQSARVSALLGIRRLRFLRVTGFDALSGPQDLRIGIQAGATLGRSLPSSRGVARDEMYAGFSGYAGMGNQWSFAAIQADLEARRPASLGSWDDVISDGRAAWYIKPHPRHLVMADLRWAGAWGARIPYQLAIGDRRGGLRGYEAVRVGGARRAVLRVEERWRVGSFRGTADAGVGIFADAGRVWAGDVPLGLDTGIRPAAGFSLMAAVPPRSQRMWRVDIAFPLDARDGARLGVRVANENRTRIFWQAPPDIRRVRERAVPQSIFSWP